MLATFEHFSDKGCLIGRPFHLVKAIVYLIFEQIFFVEFQVINETVLVKMVSTRIKLGNVTCCEGVCCVFKRTIHIQQAVVTVHHHPQHTLGQPGQGSDVVRQSLNVIINQLEGGMFSTATVQSISDPRH